MSIKDNLNLNKLAFIQFLNLSHLIDEYVFDFPRWSTEHFGTMSKSYYLFSHAIIVFIIGLIIWGIKKGSKVAIFLALSAQTVFFTNGIFHIITSLLWSQHSPGLISQIIILPASIIAYKMIHDSRVLSQKQIIYSLILGTVVSVLIILSLYLNITW